MNAKVTLLEFTQMNNMCTPTETSSRKRDATTMSYITTYSIISIRICQWTLLVKIPSLHWITSSMEEVTCVAIVNLVAGLQERREEPVRCSLTLKVNLHQAKWINPLASKLNSHHSLLWAIRSVQRIQWTDSSIVIRFEKRRICKFLS